MSAQLEQQMNFNPETKKLVERLVTTGRGAKLVTLACRRVARWPRPKARSRAAQYLANHLNLAIELRHLIADLRAGLEVPGVAALDNGTFFLPGADRIAAPYLLLAVLADALPLE